jgi:hypothetical protein
MRQADGDLYGGILGRAVIFLLGNVGVVGGNYFVMTRLVGQTRPIMQLR